MIPIREKQLMTQTYLIAFRHDWIRLFLNNLIYSYQKAKSKSCKWLWHIKVRPAVFSFLLSSYRKRLLCFDLALCFVCASTLVVAFLFSLLIFCSPSIIFPFFFFQFLVKFPNDSICRNIVYFRLTQCEICFAKQRNHISNARNEYET